eukprot:gene33693-41568_t
MDVPSALVGTATDHLSCNTSSPENTPCFGTEAVPDPVVGAPEQHLVTVGSAPATQHHSQDARNQYILADRLTILQGFAYEATATHAVYSSQHKVWKPGLRTV